MYSTTGRPRRVTDEQVKVILEWHASRKTMAQLARELGLSKSTIDHVIKVRGKYKQPSPERFATMLALARANRRRLRAAGWL